MAISDSNNENHGIEISHGSTSNQTSIYASSNKIKKRLKLCMNLSLVFLLIGLVTFLALFWIDCIPGLNRYKTSRHQQEKLVIRMVLVCVMLLLSVILLLCNFHWLSCIGSCNCWLHWVCSWKSRRSLDAFSVLTNEYNESSLAGNVNAKLNEFSEGELEHLKAILTGFDNYHDSDDWVLSTSQVISSARHNHDYVPAVLTFSAKVVLVGPPNVGKTSLFHRILYDRFSQYYMATLGADLGHVTFDLYPKEINNHILISLQVWDIAGSERFSDLSHIIYKESTAFIVVCDVNDPRSAQVSLGWLDDIKQVVFEPYVALFFNKIDLQTDRCVIPEIDKAIPEGGMFTLSAKTGEKVLENVTSCVVKALLHEVNNLL